MRFKAGDKVWCWPSKGHPILPTGKIASVVTGISPHGIGPPPWYTIDIEGYPAAKVWRATESILTPRFDDYDGDKAGDWDLCPWRPGKTKVDELVDSIEKFKERVNK